MKPVIENDVYDYDQVFCDNFDFKHTVSGFKTLEKVLVELQELTNAKPEVILEATGLYSVPVTKFIQ